MSSVSNDAAAASSKNREEATKLREEYRNKESELMKKHNQQIRSITETHMGELEKIKNSHSEQLTRYKRKSNESVTRKDQIHQKQIRDMRKAYLQKMASVRAETSDKIKAQNEYSQNERDRMKINHDRRMESMTKTYGSEMAQTKAGFDEKLSDYREQQKSAIDSQRDQLLRRQANERKQVRESHEGQVDEVKRSFDDYRQNTRDRMQRQELRHGRDTKRLSEANIAAINRERMARSDSESELREGFKASLDRTRDEYETARKKQEKARSSIGASFEKDVNNRVEKDIRRLKTKIADLKEQTVRSDVKAKRAAQRSIDDSRKAYETKYEVLLEERENQKRAYNERNGEDVAKITKEKDQQLVNNSRFYRGRLQTEEIRSKEAVRNLEANFEERVGFHKEKADTRIHQIRETHQAEEGRMMENYDKNLEAVKENNFREREELREGLIADKEKSLRALRKHVNKNEAQNARKMADIITKFKKRIAEMNDKTLRDKRLAEGRTKTLLENVKRAQVTELEATKISYEQKLAKVNDTHKQENKAQNRRHQEQLDKLLNTVRNQKA